MHNLIPRGPDTLEGVGERGWVGGVGGVSSSCFHILLYPADSRALIKIMNKHFIDFMKILNFSCISHFLEILLHAFL